VSEPILRKADDLSAAISPDLMRQAKRMGYSDRQLANIWNSTEDEIRQLRKTLEVEAVYKTVDTCAAEFEAYTPYHYSTYETENEAVRSDRPKIMILGGGPNRIGQGIEFDYCCCHASFALREDGYETIMVNSNPETVSTDYDTSDKLYFEPLTVEDVCNICDIERPDGVIVQFGGQTPLKLALPLAAAGVPIIGTDPSDIDLAEDRERFGRLNESLGVLQPPNGTATSVDEALEIARRIGYPVLVRPSYVLGGRAMVIIYDDEMLISYMDQAVSASPDHPILVDRFLEGAVELDVDAISDDDMCVIGGIMQHIERAGIHSGDSACVIPPTSVGQEVLERVREQTVALAGALNVCGLMNIQFAIQGNDVYVLEVNPRASRTVPFVSKAIGHPLAKIAARCMVGKSLESQGFTSEVIPTHMSVKEAVLPFIKFPGVDVLLGPEMRSTGEVMGISDSFGESFAKSQDSAGSDLPTEGAVFLTVDDAQKPAAVAIARSLIEMSFTIAATEGTAAHLADHDIDSRLVPKINSGERPHSLDLVKSDEFVLLINIPRGKASNLDDRKIRRAALNYGIPYTTTIEGATAAVEGIEARRTRAYTVKALQDYHTPQESTEARDGP
jgi:carbamoyl-phosphate synthase large subunit